MSISKWFLQDLTVDPAAVEKKFCIPFAELPMCLPQNIMEYRNYISLEGSQWRQVNLSDFQVLQIHAMRIRIKEYLTIRMEDRALVYLTLVSNGYRTHKMLLTYIQYWALKHNQREIDFFTVRDKIFPNGFPDEPTLQRIWYSQKVNHDTGSDNLIDHEKAQQSIQFYARTKSN